MSGDFRVRFGFFEVDLATGELFYNETRLSIQEKPFQILVLLLQKSEQLVTRQEILSNVWPDVFAPNDLSLNTAIRRLRAVLEKADPQAKLIETVGRRGYRFAAEVKLPAGLVVADGAQVTPGPRLAVIPFTNLNDGARDYFSDGLTEQMIVQLGHVYKSVSIISPVSSLSFKGTAKALPQIVRELRADYVLSGTVWRIPPRLRITAKLIRTADQRCLWSESYARQDADIFQVQDEITRNISRGLVEALPVPSASQSYLTTTPAVYETYLKARFFFYKCVDSAFEKSLQLFEQVISEDPNFAPAHAFLAVALSSAVTYGGPPPQVAYERIEGHAAKALALCDEMAEPHAALAFTRFWTADWASAESSFRRSLEINPSFSLAYAGFSYLTSVLGRRRQAIVAAKRARELDPLSPLINTMLGMVLYSAGCLSEALECQQKCIEMEPSFCAAHAMLSLIYEARGELDQAVRSSRVATQHGPDSPLMLCHLARSLAAAGDTEEATQILRALLQLRETYYIPATWLALICAALDQQEPSLTWLETAVRERDPWRLCLAVDPRFKIFWNNGRFLDVLQEIGLPTPAEA